MKVLTIDNLRNKILLTLEKALLSSFKMNSMKGIKLEQKKTADENFDPKNSKIKISLYHTGHAFLMRFFNLLYGPAWAVHDLPITL